MCQAFAGESRFFAGMRDWEVQRGFEDKLKGSPMNDKDADYVHGYLCAEKGILPYSVERSLGLDGAEPFVCPVCSEVVSRYKTSESTHNFGFPCDGSNPFDHQRKELRKKQFLELKKEFEPEIKSAK